MLKRQYVALILVLMFVTIAVGIYYYDVQQAKPSKKVYSGFWIAGRTMTPNYWVNLTKQMASSVQDSSPGNIWAVGRIELSQGTCVLSFPSNQTYPHMFFETQDRNEALFTAFDENGIKVWLEVEPGFADIDQLIDVVLERYGHHQCVLGFVVDLEWRWMWPQPQKTVPVIDEEAGRWLDKIKLYNKNGTLFLIHWLTDVMPPTARKDIVFIDDQQNFVGLDSLVNEFKLWGEHFSQGNVGYIFGYRRDLEWLSKLENPPREIASVLIQNIPNCCFVFWSHETILEVFPPS